MRSENEYQYFRSAHDRNYFQPGVINTTSWKRHLYRILENGQHLGIQKQEMKDVSGKKNNRNNANKGRIKQKLDMKGKGKQCSLAGARWLGED